MSVDNISGLEVGSVEKVSFVEFVYPREYVEEYLTESMPMEGRSLEDIAREAIKPVGGSSTHAAIGLKRFNAYNVVVRDGEKDVTFWSNRIYEPGIGYIDGVLQTISNGVNRPFQVVATRLASVEMFYPDEGDFIVNTTLPNQAPK